MGRCQCIVMLGVPPCWYRVISFSKAKDFYLFAKMPAVISGLHNSKKLWITSTFLKKTRGVPKLRSSMSTTHPNLLYYHCCLNSTTEKNATFLSIPCNRIKITEMNILNSKNFVPNKDHLNEFSRQWADHTLHTQFLRQAQKKKTIKLHVRVTADKDVF